MARILVIDGPQQRAVEMCTGLIRGWASGCGRLAVGAGAHRTHRGNQAGHHPDRNRVAVARYAGAPGGDEPRDAEAGGDVLEDGERGTIRSAIQAGVAAYVVDGFDVERLSAVVEVAEVHFEEHQALKRELAETSRKLSERKIIEKAKGVLMKTRGMEEDAAYKALRKLAMERSQPLAVVAENLVDMAKLLL